MKTLTTIAITREDLKPHYVNVEFMLVRYEMLSLYGTGVNLHEDLVIFIDTDGRTKILKNRFGNTSD